MSKITVLVRKLNRGLLEERFDDFVACLYPERQARIGKLKLREPAYASMVAGKMLQDVVQEQLGILLQDMVLEKSKYGKPHIKGHDDFHFNLSHSGDYVVLAFGDVPVGTDVERIKAMDIRVAKRCYTEMEYQLVASKGCEDVFYRIWTMKEAYLKLTGQGISVPLNSFEVDLETMRVKDTECRFDGCYVDDYYIAVCYDKFFNEHTKAGVEIIYSVEEDWTWDTISKIGLGIQLGYNFKNVLTLEME